VQKQKGSSRHKEKDGFARLTWSGTQHRRLDAVSKDAASRVEVSWDLCDVLPTASRRRRRYLVQQNRTRPEVHRPAAPTEQRPGRVGGSAIRGRPAPRHAPLPTPGVASGHADAEAMAVGVDAGAEAEALEAFLEGLKYDGDRASPSPSSAPASEVGQEGEEARLELGGAGVARGEEGDMSPLETLWETRFQELRAFKAAHGHLVVPASSPRSSLSSWVAYQRQQRRRESLSQQHQVALEALGFCWEPKRAGWEMRFHELRAFKAAHGHLVVPICGVWCSLGSWVAYQRLKQERGTLCRERRGALEALGIQWAESRGRPKTGVAEASWDKRLHELSAFKAARGHLDVPGGGAWRSLRGWLYQQRLKRQRGTLSQDRQDALKGLGICWTPIVGHNTPASAAATRPAPARRAMSYVDAKWALKLEALRGFSHAHGHTRVPSNTALHRWVHHQRRMYVKGALSDARRASLEGAGLDFNVKPRMGWEARLEELRTFQGAHGHCSVPATWRHNTPLGSWVAGQRKRRRAGTLSAEREHTLEQLGFEWEPKQPGSAASSRSFQFHRRQNASPWALVGGGSRSQRMSNGGRHSGGVEEYGGYDGEADCNGGGGGGRRVSVTWIGGPEIEVEHQRQHWHQLRSATRNSASDGDGDTRVREGVGNVKVGGWGKGSSAYEEKQQLVFDHIYTWWTGGSGDERRWRDARGKVRAMRYNLMVQTKDRRIKPDIVIEVEEIEGNKLWGLVIEVDEFAHRRGKHYSWPAEEERMRELQATLGVPLKIVRFNPDPDVANPMGLDDRTGALIEHIVESMRCAPVRALEVAYVMY